MRLIVWDYPHYAIHAGKEVFVDTFVNQFMARGHEVLFVFEGSRDRKFCQIENSPLIKFLELPEKSTLRSPSLFSTISHAKQAVRDFRPQILFSQSFFCLSRLLIDSIMSSEDCDFPQVLFVHNIKDVTKINLSLANSKSLQNIKKVLSPSHYIKERLSESPVMNKLQVLPHGSNPISENVAKQKKNHIVFTGRFVIEKGVLDLLSAWSMIYSVIPDYELFFYGDGPLSTVMKRKITELNISARTHVVGELSRSQISEVLSNSSILVLPSLLPEAFGLSVLEAMNAGLPCIVTDKGALPELIRDGLDGLVVPAHHVDALGNAIKKLAEQTDLRNLFGASSKQRVIDNYSLSESIERFEATFDELLKI